MERLNPFSFYEFGQSIQNFESLDQPFTTQKVFWPLYSLRREMEKIINGDPIPIGISSSKGRELRSRLDNLFDQRFQTDGPDGKRVIRFPDAGDDVVADWSIDFVKTSIKEFQTVFAEEMRETATYFVPRRGIYYTPALVDQADLTFPTDLLKAIPQKAREDWKAAGRCLAFNLLSASGFHVARAVEACLEEYYGLFSGKPGKTLHGWKEYIKALEAIAEKNPIPRPSAKTLAELDQMREDYRNPIVHPRVVLTEGDARMLFANGESLIIAMAQEMVAAHDGIQAALPLIGGTVSSDTAAVTAAEA